MRSGLTLTNRLSPHLSLEVGLAVSPPGTSQRPLVIPASPGGLQIDFGQTRPLPLPLASRAGGRLCFRPVGRNYFFDWSQQQCVVLPDITNEEDETVVKPVSLRTATTPEEIMDWKRLTKPGDLDECIVGCRRLTSGSEIGLYSATAFDVEKRGQATQWQLCVTAARDAFPADPVFRGGSFF